MIKKVDSYLSKNNIHSKKVIVGLSGGPDSVALISVLCSLSQKYSLIIEAAYVNHGIRNKEENLEDYTLIEQLCYKLKIKLHVCNIPQGEIKLKANELSSSIEAVARNYRYDFFYSIISQNDYIAIGHNNDDQLETQIMRFFQGSSINGLLGIKDNYNQIIRPLIEIDNEEIVAYLKKHDIDYNIDRTNLELDYLRNNIRNRLIPVINEVFPAYKTSLKKLELELNDIKSILDDSFKKAEWNKESNGYSTNYNEFINIPEYKRREEVFDIFDSTFSKGLKSYRLPRSFLIPLSKSSFKNNEIILSGHGIQFKRVGNKLLWELNQYNSLYWSIYVDKAGAFQNSNIKIVIGNDKGDGHINGLDYPFIVKSFRQGSISKSVLNKINSKVEYIDKTIIVEKDNKIYAIIYKNTIIYNVKSNDPGINIEIIQ